MKNRQETVAMAPLWFWTALFLISVTFPISGFSQVQMDVDLVFDTNATGECQFIQTPTGPYSHINSSCTLVEIDGTNIKRQNEQPISGYNLGNPPRNQTTWYWYTFLVGADPGEQYCQEFGVADAGFPQCERSLRIQLGHWSDPDQNATICGISQCETVPPPPPGPTSINSVIFLGCHQPGCALWRFTYSSSSATQYRIQFKPVGYGSWSTHAVTDSTSYHPHLGANPLSWRIRGENSSGNGPWSSTFYTSGECDGGGGSIE